MCIMNTCVRFPPEMVPPRPAPPRTTTRPHDRTAHDAARTPRAKRAHEARVKRNETQDTERGADGMVLRALMNIGARDAPR